MVAAANPSAVLDDIVERLAQLYPPRGAGKTMSDNGNGQYRALEVRVNDLHGNYRDLRDDMDTRFSALSAELSKMADSVSTRLDRIMEQGAGKSDVTKYGTILSILAAVMTSVIGGFVTLENNSISTSISALATTTKQDTTRIEGTVTDIVRTTIPRPELDNRIGTNRDDIRRVTDVQNDHSRAIATATAEAASLKADVERMKGDIVTRRENEGHWSEFQNRINLLSDRVNDLAKGTNGQSLGDQIKSLQEQLTMLQQKFVFVPQPGK